MVQLQGVTQVTNQVLSTVAILVSLLDQFKLTVSTGFAGIIVAVSCSVCHTVVKDISLLSRDIPEICSGALLPK